MGKVKKAAVATALFAGSAVGIGLIEIPISNAYSDRVIECSREFDGKEAKDCKDSTQGLQVVEAGLGVLGLGALMAAGFTGWRLYWLVAGETSLYENEGGAEPIPTET